MSSIGQSVAEAQRREQDRLQQIQREAELAEREQRQKAEHERALADVQAQRWRTRFIGILGIVLVAGLTGAFILNDEWNKRVLLEQQKRTLEQRQLTRLADLKAVAMANGGQPIWLLPDYRRLGRYQELGVLLHEVEDSAKLPVNAKHRSRVGSLEAEADTVMRQALDQTVDVRRLTEDVRRLVARDGQVPAIVGECLQRAEGGARRQVLSTSMVPLEREISGWTGADTFAMLTRVNDKIALETIELTQLRAQSGPSFFASSCQVGSDQAVMDIAPTNDVALDPTGRWLIERPKAPGGAFTGSGPPAGWTCSRFACLRRPVHATSVSGMSSTNSSGIIVSSRREASCRSPRLICRQ